MALIRYEFYYMMIDNDLVTSVVFTTSFYYLIINEFGSNFDLELKIILGLTTLGFLYSIFHNDYSHVFIYLINTLLKIGVSWKNSYEKRKTYKESDSIARTLTSHIITFDEQPEPVIYYDPESLQIIHYNRKSEAILKYKGNQKSIVH